MVHVRHECGVVPGHASCHVTFNMLNVLTHIFTIPIRNTGYSYITLLHTHYLLFIRVGVCK